MKKYWLMAFVVVLLLPVIGLWGCGGDDDDDDGGDGDTTPVVTAVTATSAPAAVTASTWSTAVAATVPIGANLPGFKRTGSAAQAVADDVRIQAAVYGDSLYVKVTWDDETFDVWPSAWIVDSIDGGLPLWEHLTTQYEDQLMLFVSGLPNGNWDTWHWRAATTSFMGSPTGQMTGYAEGGRYVNNAVTPDASPTFLTRENHQYIGFNRPTFLHEDTTEYTGYILADQDADSLVTLPASGWTQGFLVAGYLTNVGIALLPDASRGSKYDIKVDAKYDAGANQYQVVMRRALNTGYTEDLVMTSGSRLTCRIGIGNEHNFTFTTGSSNQGYSDVFYIDLP